MSTSPGITVTRFLWLQAYVIRLLRTRADKPNVKSGKAVASVTLTELMNAFQSMSIAVAGREHMAKLLREE